MCKKQEYLSDKTYLTSKPDLLDAEFTILIGPDGIKQNLRLHESAGTIQLEHKTVNPDTLTEVSITKEYLKILYDISQNIGLSIKPAK